jgi:DNA replication protein DnaC
MEEIEEISKRMMERVSQREENTQDSGPLLKSEILNLYDKIKSKTVIDYLVCAREEFKILENQVEAGIPKKYLFAEMESIPSSIKKQLDGFDIGKGFYIWGGIGTGKTHLICAIVNSFIRKCRDKGKVDFRYRPKLASVPDILLSVKQSFSEDRISEQDIIWKYTQYPCLILDDLGTEKASEWVIQTLYSIVDTRYKEDKQTCFTSNLSLDKISEKIGDRIPSRIAEMCEIVQIKGADRRIKGGLS